MEGRKATRKSRHIEPPAEDSSKAKAKARRLPSSSSSSSSPSSSPSKAKARRLPSSSSTSTSKAGARRLPSSSSTSKAGARQLPSSSSSSSLSKATTRLHRVTEYRRRKAKERDGEALAQAESVLPEPGQPCELCETPMTLAGGHAFYRGQRFCQSEQGPGRTAQQWLEDVVDDMNVMPRTSAWNFKKRWEKEGKEGGKKTRKGFKIRICQLCGQPRQKDFGHSQIMGEHFCTLHAGISVELWLAHKRKGRK